MLLDVEVMPKSLYKNDLQNTARYILGQVTGSRPLVCIGINPSTATPDCLDNTLKAVRRLARINGYDGWIMLNVYPQRATNPNNLDEEANLVQCETNQAHIKALLAEYKPTIWAAWGTLINKRRYLVDCLRSIAGIVTSLQLPVITIGSRSKEGHPHHPLYLSTQADVSEFNLAAYLSSLL